MTAPAKLKMNKTKARQHLLVLWQEYVRELEEASGKGKDIWPEFKGLDEVTYQFATWLKRS